MNKRGVALILAYGVVAVLTILSVGFIARGISEKRTVERQVHSTRAFWTAEAGLAQTMRNLLAIRAAGVFPHVEDEDDAFNYGDGNVYAYVTTTNPHLHCADCFEISSTGTVTLASGGTIARTVVAIVERVPNPIEDAITVSQDLTLRGNAEIAGNVTAGSNITLQGAAKIDGDANDNVAWNDFDGIFGITIDQFRDQADNIYYIDDDYRPETADLNIEGLTYIEITGAQYVFAGNWSGSGILVIVGNAKITTGDFDGIIWGEGSPQLVDGAGNADIAGAIFWDNIGGGTVLTGTIDIAFDQAAVEAAWNELKANIHIWYES